MKEGEIGHVERFYVPETGGKRRRRSRKEVLRARDRWKKERAVT